MSDSQKPMESKEEQIGFHKGSLVTLAKERQELGRLLSIVEQLMQMHISNLKQLGVDLESLSAAQQKSNPGKDVPKMDDLLG